MSEVNMKDERSAQERGRHDDVHDQLQEIDDVESAQSMLVGSVDTRLRESQFSQHFRRSFCQAMEQLKDLARQPEGVSANEAAMAQLVVHNIRDTVLAMSEADQRNSGVLLSDETTERHVASQQIVTVEETVISVPVDGVSVPVDCKVQQTASQHIAVQSSDECGDDEQKCFAKLVKQSIAHEQMTCCLRLMRLGHAFTRRSSPSKQTVRAEGTVSIRHEAQMYRQTLEELQRLTTQPMETFYVFPHATDTLQPSSTSKIVHHSRDDRIVRVGVMAIRQQKMGSSQRQTNPMHNVVQIQQPPKLVIREEEVVKVEETLGQTCNELEHVTHQQSNHQRPGLQALPHGQSQGNESEDAHVPDGRRDKVVEKALRHMQLQGSVELTRMMSKTLRSKVPLHQTMEGEEAITVIRDRHPVHQRMTQSQQLTSPCAVQSTSDRQLLMQSHHDNGAVIDRATGSESGDGRSVLTVRCETHGHDVSHEDCVAAEIQVTDESSSGSQATTEMSACQQEHQSERQQVAEATTGDQQYLSRPVTYGELTHIASYARDRWKILARCLLPRPFTEEMLADFETKRPENLYEQALVMLEEWSRKYGDAATVQSLCQALVRAGCRRSAEMEFSAPLVEWIVTNMTHSYSIDEDSVQIELFELAQHVGTGWPALAGMLGFCENAIDIIKTDVQTTIERALKMLSDWYQRVGIHADLDDVRLKVKTIAEKEKRKQESRQIFPTNLRDHRLYGRDQELNEIAAVYWQRVSHHVVTSIDAFCLQMIIGLGGIGKSSAAAGYAVRFKNAYVDGVFFFNAESWPMLHTSIRQNMAELGVAPTGGDMMEDNKRFLACIYEKSKVLLLYDSADDLDIVAHVLPRDTAQVHVLITTRFNGNHELISRAHHVTRLGYLPIKDGVSALCGWSQRPQPLEGLELACAEQMVSGPPIEGLPLAITHAAVFMRMTGMSFQVYFDLLMKKEEELSAAALDIDKLLQYFRVTHLRDQLARVHVTKPHHLQQFADEIIQSMDISMYDKQLIFKAKQWMSQSKHTYLTWQLDIDAVAMTSRDGMTVLEYCSLMAGRDIPGHLLQLVSFPEKGRRAASQFSVAILELSSYTLITTVESNEQYSVNIHTLVQETVFERLMKDPHNLYNKLQLLAQCFLDMIGSVDSFWRVSNNELVMLTPHVYSLAEKILMMGCLDGVHNQLVLTACHIACESPHVSVAYHLSYKHLALVELSYQDASDVESVQVKVKALYYMGWACMVAIKLTEAQNYLVRTVQLMKEVGEQHELTQLKELHFQVLLMLGTICTMLHQHEDAQHFFSSSLSLLATDGPQYEGKVAEVMMSLAFSYQESGNLYKAINTYQQILEIQRQNNVHTGWTTARQGLAMCLFKVGDFCQAAAVAEQSLTIMRQYLPANQFHVARVLLTLSHSYRCLHDIPRAKRSAEESLAIITSTFPQQHPAIAEHMNALAACYFSSGDVGHAIDLYKQVISMFRTHCMVNILAAALANLGTCYTMKGMWREALAALHESLTIQRASLPQLHPDIAKTLHLTGKVHWDSGNIEKAVQILRESMEIAEQTIPVHPLTVEVLRLLAGHAFKEKQYGEAEHLLLRCRDILRQVAPMSEVMARVCFGLGAVHHVSLRLLEAEEATTEALEIFSALPQGQSLIQQAEQQLHQIWQAKFGN